MFSDLPEIFIHTPTEKKSSPFYRPTHHWFIYPWLGMFLVGILAIGITSYVKFGLSASSIVSNIFAFYIRSGFVVTTVLSTFLWLFNFFGRSYIAVDYYRSKILKKLNEPIVWADRVKSDQGWGYVYLGTRLRCMGDSFRHQVLSSGSYRHMLVLGGRQAMWWQRFFHPHLALAAEWGNSSVIIDPESTVERAERYSSMYADQGYDVQIFTPYESRSHHLYLLEGAHNKDTAQELAAIVVPTNEASADDERLLLAKLIFALSKRGAVTLGAVARLLKTNRRVVEAILLDDTESEWGFDELSTLVCQRLATRLGGFDNDNLCRFSQPSSVHSNVNLGYGNEIVFAYAGFPANTSGKDILLRLTLRAISRQLLEPATDLINPILFLPNLETYGYIPRFAQTLQSLRSAEVSICTSLPSAQVGMQIYGQEFHQLKAACELSLRFPRYAKPGDIELFRLSPAQLEPTHRHTHMGNIWQRLRQPAHFQPLLIPWHKQFRWTADEAILQCKGEWPMSVSLPNKEEYSKTSGLLQQLATQTEQTLRSVENLINSRELRPQLALESGNHAVDVPETEEVADHDYFETEKTNVGYQQEVYAADLLPEISIEEEGIPPQELIIEIRPNIEFESQGDLEDTNAVPIQPLILGSSLNGKALECLKAWAIKRHTKAVEILNKRVKGNQNNTKAASYYYQKRSFALSLDMVPPKELAWLGQQDAQHQEISLWGHEHSVKVVVIPEDLAVQRPKLQAIIMTHLSELENSAPFQSLELAERKSVLVSGYYYPRLMLVPMSTLKTVLKDVDSRPLNELEEVRLSVGGKNPRIRMVLLDDAPLLASS